MTGMTMEFAAAWRDAAAADGWSIEPSYPNHEGIERSATLRRDGYVARVLTRSGSDCDVSVWGPDRLWIEITGPYDFAALAAGTKTCAECGATGVETVRVGFAGRVCEACRPAVAKRVEVGNWTA